jgi:pimeloyl-ACP methyl ester carboxylesterase
VTRLLRFRHDGLLFDVRDEGPLDGDPVVLLHGFPERASCWREVAPLLHAQGLRTYAPDQRGYSPGARPQRRRDYAIPELVGDVVALVEAIDRPVHLVGHDWGATVGWSVAAHHPELVRSWTAVSVPHSAAMVRAWATSRQLVRSWYMAAFQLPRLPEWTATGASGRMDRSLRGAGMTADEVARFHEEIVDYGALTGALNWYRGLPLTPPSYSSARVRVPTTMVWSDGDVAIVRNGVERTAANVDADYRLVVLEGVSHWIPTQAAEPLAEAILARIGSTGRATG